MTLAFNVPLNNQLAAANPTAATAAATWRAFYDPWMFWNLVRTFASIVTFVLFGATMWLEATQR